jgi:alkylation response protein AidB-like acyl-CoA dehydrogenase
MSAAATERVAPDEAERQALREAVREVCARHAGADEARRLLDATPEAVPDPALWRALTSELGIGGLVTAERFGGAQAGWSVLQVVLAELGAALACTPFVASTVMASALLQASGDEQAGLDLLPAIADGRVVATVAVVERDTGWDDWCGAAAPVGAATHAQAGVDGWQVTGAKRVVAFGASADLLLVAAETGGSTAVFAVDAQADGVGGQALPTLDGTRPVADVTFDAAPARLIGAVGDAGAALRRMLDLGGLAVAAEDAGAMRHSLRTAVDYALLRKQFDRTIGSFQAVKHKLADLLVRVELAEAAVEEACLLLDADDPTAAVAAVIAHACAAESFKLVAAETIQTHGGIGFTWEHPAHLYFRRAKTSELVFGGPARYRERVLDRLNLGEGATARP